MPHDPSYSLLGARCMLDRLQEMVKLTHAVRESETREAIHQMRVASRRLRAAFGVFDDLLKVKGAKTWKKQIKLTTKALGAARDLDVQMECLEWQLDQLDESASKAAKPGIERMLLRLQQARTAVQPRVIRAMDRLEASPVFEKMGDHLRQLIVEAGLKTGDTRSTYVYEQAYRHIAMCIEELLAYDPYVNRPECVEELHDMRISAKRLRYSIELFEPVYDGRLKKPRKAFRDMQNLLGDIHDADVWLDFLPEFIEDERARTIEFFGNTRTFGRIQRGIHWLIEQRKQARQREYENFVAKWGLMKNEQFWDRLRDIVRRPLVESSTADAPSAPATPVSPVPDVVNDSNAGSIQCSTPDEPKAPATTETDTTNSNNESAA